MKVKRQQLQELIRLITKKVLKEYSSMSSGKDEEETNADGQDTVPVDALSPAAKSKLRREKEMARRDDVKQKEKELDVAKKEMDFQKQKVDQSKRFAIPNLTKDIQRLKGGQI